VKLFRNAFTTRIPARRLSGAANHMLVAEAALIEGKPAPSTAYFLFPFTLSGLSL
jgi:hypothetical protein